MENLILKVGSDGDIFLNFREVSLPEMVEAVEALKARGGFVTYYRESPEMEGTAAASAAFQRLIELKPAIRLGTNAPSEWGKLDWVEVEEAPLVSRFFLARGQRFLIAVPGGDAPKTYVGGPLSGQVEDTLFSRLDLLVRSDRVMETPMHQPEMCFTPPAQAQASVHIRLSYGAERWASHYVLEDVPDNIRSFQHDVARLGQRIVTKP